MYYQKNYCRLRLYMIYERWYPSVQKKSQLFILNVNGKKNVVEIIIQCTVVLLETWVKQNFI